MTSTALNVPKDVNVEASGNYGDPGINYDYIYNRTKNLSHIVLEEPEYWNESRFFGSLGEQHAAEDIEQWMKDIDLYDVHLETIDSWWTWPDEGGLYKNSMYLGPLNLSRVMKTYYINITIYNISNNWAVVGYKNLSRTECFPYFQNGLMDIKERNEENISIYHDFKYLRFEKQMELGDTHWTTGYDVWKISQLKNWWHKHYYKGYIAIDNDSKAHIQFPPLYDHLLKKWLFDTPAFFINKTVGDWIEDYLLDEDFRVKADYHTKWKKQNVTSYNVIGQINGTDTSKVTIICAHYDCMWNQGTIDEAGETAIVLAIGNI
jgi:hypothetical protein